MEHNEIEWNRAEQNNDSVPLFGYFMMEWTKIMIPLFEK